MSFAARLLEWLLAPLLFLWLVGLGITFLASRHTVDAALDEQLARTAQVIVGEWQEHVAAELQQSAFPTQTLRRLLTQDAQHPIRYLIVDQQSRVIAGDEVMLPLLRPQEGDEVAMLSTAVSDVRGITTVLDEEFVRSVRFVSPGVKDTYRLVVAQARASQSRKLQSILAYEAVPHTAGILIAVFLVWYGLAYVVRPMRQLKQHIDTRSAGDLRALPAQLAPTELAPLIQSINDLMGRLQTSNSAQNRFIANAAHQLRTPLAAVRAHTELLRKTEDPAKQRETIAQLLATTARANRLANQLLSLARAESAGTTGAFGSVDLGKICQGAAGEMLPLAMEKNIDLALEKQEETVIVSGDATLLSELVYNLLDNAIKYTPLGGSVQLTVKRRPLCLIVEDSGPGVTPQERERIFAPFARAARFEAGAQHPIAGSGLGLAIAEQVARTHRASISVADSELGGASFQVNFVSLSPSMVAELLADPYGAAH